MNIQRAIHEGIFSSILMLVLNVTLFQHRPYFSLVEFGALLLGQVILAALSKSDQIPDSLTATTFLCTVVVLTSYQSFNVASLWFGVIGGMFAFELGMVGLSVRPPLSIIAIIVTMLAFLFLGLVPGVLTFQLLSLVEFTRNSLWLAAVVGAVMGFTLSFLPSILLRGFRMTAATASRQGLATLIPGCVSGSIFGLWSGIHTLRLDTPILGVPGESELSSLVTGVWLVLFGIVFGNKILQLVQQSVKNITMESSAN